ncbi:MAG: cation-translocating P-type ATPase [Caldiserica bacterium]|nr:cation-translocating P-type ATPase [Caldisericota bacterium]
MATQTPWTQTPHEVATALSTDAHAGLTAKEAARRLQEQGPNQLTAARGKSPWRLFAGQFKGVVIWVLMAAAILSGVMGELVDALAIVAIIVLNAVLGYVQESRAERSLAALRRMSNPVCHVLRDGHLLSIDTQDLVPGDVIVVEAGDRIPADARILSPTPNFATEEASLTGEAAAIRKEAATLQDQNTPIADRSNMLFTGTSVVEGKAHAVVTTTGMQTELGRIAGMIQQIPEEATPLQRKLDLLGKQLVIVSLGLVAIVFAAEMLHGGGFMNTLLVAVSLAVAAVPEGLPAVVTIALAMGVQRMVKRHALVRKLHSVETLGATTVICTDKTGTLTRNEMTVRAIVTPDATYTVTGVGYEPTGTIQIDGTDVDPSARNDLMAALYAAVLCNGANLNQDEDEAWSVVGDPTEGALLVAAQKAGVDRASVWEDQSLVAELPFDARRKCMSMIRRDEGGRLVVYTKGAPDVVLGFCPNALVDGAVVPLGENRRRHILTSNEALATQTLRVLAVAQSRPRDDGSALAPESVERDLTFLGLIAMMDPPRDEVRSAMTECADAGIKTIMITGDHKATAVAIARDLGFYHDESQALSGRELDELSDEAFDEQLPKVAVYARVAPEHKLRIVRAWRKRGEIVSMTGDGVNDAPAIKEADIGVAMGITGTDVTKEVADMVITDDNFASIVAAVEEGRAIYDNILKFVHYLLSCNLGEIILMFLASVLGQSAPLIPVQILWMNLVTDGLPALALGIDPPAEGLMARRPRKPDALLLSRTRTTILLIQAFSIGLCALAAFIVVLRVEHGSLIRARTMAFTVIVLAELFQAFNARSLRESAFSRKLHANWNLVYAVLGSLALQLVLIYVPLLHRIFQTESLSGLDLGIGVAMASMTLWATEIAKLFLRHSTKGEDD